MHVNAIARAPSNLMIAWIEAGRRAGPSAGPSHCRSLRQSAAACHRDVPPTLKPADARLPRHPLQPAMWPHKWPEQLESPEPAPDPPPDRPYLPHRIPPTTLGLHRDGLSKFASPAADLIRRLIDLYA